MTRDELFDKILELLKGAESGYIDYLQTLVDISGDYLNIEELKDLAKSDPYKIARNLIEEGIVDERYFIEDSNSIKMKFNQWLKENYNLDIITFSEKPEGYKRRLRASYDYYLHPEDYEDVEYKDSESKKVLNPKIWNPDNSLKPEIKDKALSIGDVIKKIPEGYVIYSEKGKKLSKAYATKEDAEKRLKEIEMFKHISDSYNKIYDTIIVRVKYYGKDPFLQEIPVINNNIKLSIQQYLKVLGKGYSVTYVKPGKTHKNESKYEQLKLFELDSVKGDNMIEHEDIVEKAFKEYIKCLEKSEEGKFEYSDKLIEYLHKLEELSNMTEKEIFGMLEEMKERKEIIKDAEDIKKLKEYKLDSNKLIDLTKKCAEVLRKGLVKEGYKDEGGDEIFFDAEFHIRHEKYKEKDIISLTGNPDWQGSEFEEDITNEIEDEILEEYPDAEFKWFNNSAGGYWILTKKGE